MFVRVLLQEKMQIDISKWFPMHSPGRDEK